MSKIDRRSFVLQSMGSVLTYSLLETLFAREAFAANVKPTVVRWLHDVNEHARELKEGKFSATEWQTKIEDLFSKVELPELLKWMDMERIVDRYELPDNGARSIRFKFPEVEGIPKQLIFGQQIFGMKEGRSVVPHGHNNMATAFLILRGDFHGRLYDRIEDRGDDIVIKPTIDRTFETGEPSTISDDRDNVHWFKAKQDGSYIFNIHVLNVVDNFTQPTGRVYLDPSGTPQPGGTIIAPRISYSQAHERFG